MVNLEHKLTVDDLIVEYMTCKIEKGYKPEFLTSEFISFLYFFESKIEVQDSLYNNYELFQRFFERKSDWDWSKTINYSTMEKEFNPHMEMVYSVKDDDYLIKPNYKLSCFDRSIINTYFMNKNEVKKIRDIIGEWLSNYPKREIDESVELTDNDIIMGKYIAAEIISNIWDSYIKQEIKHQTWPKQCKDINKYLFKLDLAEIIGVKSIKNKLVELYKVLSKRIAVLYHEDKNLQISSYSNVYLSKENFDLLIKGYENMISIAFGDYKKSLNIDLSKLTFKESHELDGVYAWYEDPDVKTTETKIGNENVKKLVRNFDENIKNT